MNVDVPFPFFFHRELTVSYSDLQLSLIFMMEDSEFLVAMVVKAQRGHPTVENLHSSLRPTIGES